VNSRRLDDTILTLAASGWTYRDTFVLFDHETESLWFPMEDDDGVTRFMGIAGTHAGRMLEGLPFSRALWLEWVEDHPGSSVLL